MIRYLLLLVCFGISLKAFAYDSLKYYDPINVSRNYQGVLSFTHDFSNVMMYFHNNWSYYLVYYEGNRVVKYQYIQNGNILSEEHYSYQEHALQSITRVIQGRQISTLFILDPSKTKRLFHDTGHYVLFHYSGKLLTQVSRYDTTDVLLYSTAIQYNNKNLEALHTHSNAQGIEGYTEFYYDNDGLRSKAVVLDKAKQVVQVDLFFYELGQLMLVKTYDKDNHYLGSIHYEYDEQKQLRYILHYDEKDQLIIR